MAKSASLGTPLRNPPQALAAPAALPPGSDQIFKVALGDAPQKGSPDAKVTIVEWSDFECPFCSRAVETLRQIEKSYGSDVRFVFKHNPLPMHPDAPYAAKASIAAQKQGKFWQMHDKLFDASASRQPDALKQDKVDAMARSLGLDMDRYKRDVDAAETAQVIRDDQAQAAKLATGAAKKDLYEQLTKDGLSGPPAPPPQAAPLPQARNVDPGEGPFIGA